MRAFLTDQTGASAAEYALIIAVVGVGIGAATLVLGNNVTAAIGVASNRIHAVNSLGAEDTGNGGGNGGSGADSGGNGPPTTAPGQNPGPGNGNSNGNQNPGTPPSSPPGNGGGKPNKG